MPQLSDFEYQVAITLKGVVQPFTSWITCTEENSKLVGGVPKVDVGNVRVEAGNFRLRPKSNPELVQSNERPYLPKPGPRMYRGTDINSYEDWYSIADLAAAISGIDTVYNVTLLPVDGTNAVFETPLPFVPGKLSLFANGLRLELMDDYQTTGNNSITLNEPLGPGEKLTADFIVLT